MHDEDAKVTWELFCVYCEKFSKVIPTTFLLGFYVTQVGRHSNCQTIHSILGELSKIHQTISLESIKKNKC